MGYAAFDTLEAATKLEKSGIEREQAITFVSVMRDVNNDAKLATKQDLREEINSLRFELKEDIANVRTELKEDIANVRTELKEDIANVRTELKEDIANVRTEIVAVKGDIKSLNLVGVLILGAIFAQLINSIFKIW